MSSAALPYKIFSATLHRHASGRAFGAHVDNAIRYLRGTDFRIRSDLSMTVFIQLGTTIEKLSTECGIDDARVVELTGIYHNLLRPGW